jgi:tetratricopeptide (TPR) repeat protein
MISSYVSTLLVDRLVLTIKLNSKITRDNQLFLHYLQKNSQKVKVVYSPEASIKPPMTTDEEYLNWSCFVSVKNFDYDNNAENILYFAWRCAELGAEEIGLRLLDKANKFATKIFFRHMYLVQLQFMRIATQYYEEAANETRTMPFQFDDFLHLLYLTKAWGCILSRRTAEAKYYFGLAEITPDTVPKDIDSLYRMNIYALSQHLNGETESALMIENRIKDAISALDKSRPQITYINSINLARLHRHLGDFSTAKKYYDKAFNTNRNEKSETDYIYAEVCFGMLCEKQDDLPNALFHWLSAAVHWLNAEVPEALGWRAVRAIAMPAFKPRTMLEPVVIDNAFIKKLTELNRKAGTTFCISTSHTSHKNLIDITNTMLSNPIYVEKALADKRKVPQHI